MKNILAFLACAALTAGITGCGGGDDDTVVIVDSSAPLTVRWTIDGTIDSGACAFYRADLFELVVLDIDGRVVTELASPCEDFEISVELLEGSYDADATLIDAFDRPVTVTEQLNDLRVIPGTELVVDVDFPVTSIL
jgi:hypothetical protein